MTLNENEAARYRNVRIGSPMSIHCDVYSGDQVHSITEKGIVISTGVTRTLYPWHNVTSFTYHANDVTARKAVQGY